MNFKKKFRGKRTKSRQSRHPSQSINTDDENNNSGTSCESQPKSKAHRKTSTPLVGARKPKFDSFNFDDMSPIREAETRSSLANFNPVRITGVSNADPNDLIFTVEWKNKFCKRVITGQQAREFWPQVLIDFYESLLLWKD
jgi:Chromo shadow domain